MISHTPPPHADPLPPAGDTPAGATPQSSAARTAASYDATPYPSLAHRSTHPGQLAALATLLGLDPAPPASARLLEIGCAGGSNLIPMAIQLPGASFAGVDISARQIDQARADSAAFGLTNIRFEAIDLAALTSTPPPLDGPFDYIVAHGLYSWIDDAAREALLAACAALLAPHGVAYISYNCYPGWHALESLRQMLLYDTRGISHPAERARRARSLLDLLAAAQPPERTPQGAIIHSFRDYLRGGSADFGPEQRAESDAYLLHEHLEVENHPCYFYQFADHAGDHGLQYLCDADLRLDFAHGFPPDVAELIAARAASLVELQQYMDFARNRTFRKTLLCRAEAPVTRSLRADRLRGLWFASPAVPESPQPALRPVSVENFRTKSGVSLAIDHPLSKAAFLALVRRWPDALAFDELVQAGVQLLRAEAPAPPLPRDAPPLLRDAPLLLRDDDVAQMALTLLRACTSSESLLEISALPQACTARIAPRPVSSRWARYQLAGDGLAVTNLRHERVRLDPLEAEIVRLLDGSRDVAALCARLEPAVRTGAIAFGEGSSTTPVPPGDAAAALLPVEIGARIATLARAALLER